MAAVPIQSKLPWRMVLPTAICLLAVALQILLYRNAGSIWRDEASSVLVARAPDLREFWNALPQDSFPALFAGLLRTWIDCGPGASEAGLRWFGTLVAVGIIVAIPISARVMGDRAPWIALALIALNPTIFYYGSSIRAYGLAALLILPCLAAFWRVTHRPTRLNVAVALALALLSVHSNYQNTYLLLAIGLAGALAAAIAGRWKRALLILSLGALAGLSLLVYLPIIRDYRAAALIHVTHWGPRTIASRFAESLAGESRWLLTLWIVLGLAALGNLAWQVSHLRHRRRPSRAVFALAAILVAAASAVIFFRVNRMYPFPWHFVPLVGLLALLLDIALPRPRNVFGSAAPALAAVLVALASLSPVWKAAHLRRTNLDAVAQRIAREAQPGDLILVNPFYLAPGFRYQYHGPARWSILPLASDPEDPSWFPSYAAMIKRRMSTPNVLRQTLEEIRATLSSEHRVWFPGGLAIEASGTAPADLPAAPNSPLGWDSNAYVARWSAQVGHFIHTHSRWQFDPMKLPCPVSPLEDMPLVWAEGWKEEGVDRQH